MPSPQWQKMTGASGGLGCGAGVIPHIDIRQGVSRTGLEQSHGKSY